MEYLAIVTREGEQELAEFPDAPGCATFADAGEDIVEEAREALEGWLESALAHGEVPPRPSAVVEAPQGGRPVRVRIAPALAVRLQLRWAV